MGEYKTRVIKYVFDELEKALSMTEEIKELFKKENIYISHKIDVTQNGRYKIEFKIYDKSGTNL